jgi:hypothetical protein
MSVVIRVLSKHRCGTIRGVAGAPLLCGNRYILFGFQGD